MKKILSIAICLAVCLGVSSQTNNKQKLAQLDSLTRIMDQKKKILGAQLDDFYLHSRELEKQKDSSIKGTTIEQRLASINRDIRNRASNRKAPLSNPARSALEETVAKISLTMQEIETLKKQWTNKKDSINEMGEMDMLMLQQMMDKKNQLESMISNVMKAGYEGGQAAVQALKAS